MTTEIERPATLTTGFIKGVKEPGRYGDRRGSYGLSLMVRETSAGRLSKAFAQRLRFEGQAFNIGLGSFPLVSLARARELAFTNAQQVSNGIDIRASKRQRRMIPTFASAADATIAAHAAGWKGGKTEQNSRAMLTKYVLPTLGKERIDKVTSPDVVACLTPIWHDKAATAKRVHVMLKMVFDWARAQGFITENPADSITGALGKQQAAEHHDACPWQDVPAAVKGFRTTKAAAYSKLAFEFIVLTASRLTEVRAARWEEIDLDGKTWTIPASRMKSGKQHRVPLSDASMDVLNGAYALTGGVGLIFANTAGKAFSLATLVQTLRRNQSEYTVHGFRSSFRDWCADNNIDRELAEVSLAHKVGGDVEHAYWRSDILDLRREIMDKWAAHVISGV